MVPTRVSTTYAGANRIRFEGLRCSALSALLRSPVVSLTPDHG